MHDASSAGGVVADGPYRYMRNPLYLGTMLHTLAVALLMPLSGALFAVVAIAIEQMRLIGGEEAFLEGKLGERYLAYKQAVPRIVPAGGFPLRHPLSGFRFDDYSFCSGEDKAIFLGFKDDHWMSKSVRM